MTEEEWRACTDPQKMLAFVHRQVSTRTLRLFAIRCCDHVRFVISGWPAKGEWLDVAARYAECEATAEELAAAVQEIEENNHCHGPVTWWPGGQVLAAHTLACSETAPDEEEYRHAGAVLEQAACAVASERVFRGGPDPSPRSTVPDPAESRYQADLLREVVGNPFAAPPAVPAWLTWENGLLARLAEGIRLEGAADRLPILADALEDAGCTEAPLLEHLRRSHPHLRTCWALDRMVGKR
jgi:hypothetical protein